MLIKIQNININDGYQCGLVSMIYKRFDKKTSVQRANKFAGCGIKNENKYLLNK